MQLLILILKQIELTDLLMQELARVGVKGGTILDGTGMAKSLADMDDLPMFGMLRHLMEESNANSKSKVLIFVLRDEEMIKAKFAIKKVIDFKKSNTGIMFSIPITYVEGLGE